MRLRPRTAQLGGATVPADEDRPGIADFAGLDEEKQARIWDLEHNTFELEWKFGKSFTKALQQRDHQATPAVLSGFIFRKCSEKCTGDD